MIFDEKRKERLGAEILVIIRGSNLQRLGGILERRGMRDAQGSVGRPVRTRFVIQVTSPVPTARPGKLARKQSDICEANH